MASKERVLMLFDVGEPLPADHDFSRELKHFDWMTEADIVEALEWLECEVEMVAIHDDLDPVRQKVRSFRPTIIFNQAEEFRGRLGLEAHVAAFLEMLGLPFTGCGALGITLSKHKDISKQILQHQGIRVPRFAILPRGHGGRRPDHLAFPLFIKPRQSEASFGIATASLVRTERQFERRVAYIHESFRQDAVAEEFIDGREFYVSLIGNRQLTVFPPRELKFHRWPRGQPMFATYRSKWDLPFRDRWGVDTEFPRRLAPRLRREMDRTSKTIYRLLGIQGYARLDFRLSHQGELVFLEANPNPHLAANEDFALSAEKAGYTFPELIWKIITLGKAARRG